MKKLFPKGVRISFSKKKRQKGRARTGSLYLIAVLGLITAGGVIAVGGGTPDLKPDSYDPQKVDPFSCCDSGNGTACRPLNDQTITFQGKEYGLLKSNILIRSIHLYGSNEFASDGQRIYINSSDLTADFTIPGCERGKDLISLDHTDKFPHPCLGIPNDQIVYVCTSKDQCEPDPKGKTYNAYFRLSDGLVPSPIAFLCPKPKNPVPTGQQFTQPSQTTAEQKLQLETFQLRSIYEPVEWLAPWPLK